MFNLTEAILHGKKSDVVRLLREGAPVDEIDEYGFTPLIETAIVNKTSLGELLICHGANVNVPDVTLRYPLHWTIDNNNLAFSKLLLNKGANANAYSRSAQPILVLPLLRKQNDLKQLLYQFGANLDFALDYINAKLLAHRFELEGQVHIVNTNNEFILLDLEGFLFEFTSGIIQDSLSRYKNNYAAKHLQHLFKKIDKIIYALSHASELLKYQQYTIDLKPLQKRINLLINFDPLLIPVAYHGHGISCIKFRDYFIKCDRGAHSRKIGHTVVIYKITKPQNLTANFIKNLFYKGKNELFVHYEMNEILGLQPIDELPVSSQITGNCSWANVEAAIPALLYILLAEKATSLEQFNHAKLIAMDFFYQWQDWDKERALDECIQSFLKASTARKASKVALLANILVHRCDYTNKKDIERAEKILPILKTQGFEYILDSYLRIYAKDSQNPIGKNLKNLIDIAFFN